MQAEHADQAERRKTVQEEQPAEGRLRQPVGTLPPRCIDLQEHDQAGRDDDQRQDRDDRVHALLCRRVLAGFGLAIERFAEVAGSHRHRTQVLCK